MAEAPRSLVGHLEKISGPVCQASGLEACGLYDLVEVGPRGLIGEIIRFQGALATLQVYEDDTGLHIGDEVTSRGEPLGVDLGPGLLGSIFDGIQRPLRDLFDQEGAFLKPGSRQAPLDPARTFAFTPVLTPPCPLVPGQVWATVLEGETLVHKLLVPPRFRGRHLVSLRGPGLYRLDEVLGLADSGEELTMVQRWPVRTPRPHGGRLGTGEPLLTGLRVIDTFFPLAKGGAAAIPGGFGTGKTMTQQAVAKGCDADIIVYVGCGERGNEMTDVLTSFPELTDPRTGRSLMERTVLIANTSNMPVAAREVSIYTGVTLAEYYRDMGLHVALLADSTSRWAEALRELGGRLEEMPAEEGFPAYLPTRLAEFYERGGLVKTLGGETGSVTLIGAVSPPGGDFSEPVTQHTRRFIRCFWALDRDLANARHYPAISWLDSYSDYVNDIAPWWKKTGPGWEDRRRRALEILKEEQKLLEIVRLVGSESLPAGQKLVLATADLLKTGFLQQNTYDEVDRFCPGVKQAALLDLILDFHRRAEELLEAGNPLAPVLGLPIREDLARAKTQISGHENDRWTDLARDLDDQFAALEGRQP